LNGASHGSSSVNIHNLHAANQLNIEKPQNNLEAQKSIITGKKIIKSLYEISKLIK